MRYLLVFLLLLITIACSQDEKQDADLKVPNATADNSPGLTAAEDEFPIPELTKENLKDVNALVMEQLQQQLIDESREQANDGHEEDLFPIGEVVKPTVIIDLVPPEFELQIDTDQQAEQQPEEND